MKVRVHALVSGRVQGVFYRAFTREKAIEHSVKGWVRNLVDGRVEAVLEGKKEDVDQLINDLKKGSPSARVDRIDIKSEDYRDEFKEFHVWSHFDKI
jgi:acylphosphatase